MSQNKLTEYCFLIFLFLLPFQTVFLLREPFIDGEKWQYGTIGIYAVDILLLFLLVMWSAGRCSEWRTRIPDILSQKTVVLLALFVLWAGLSVFWATDSLLAFSFFLKLLLAAGLFLFLRSWNELSLRKVVFVLLAAGVLQSGIGITQFLTQETASSVDRKSVV